MHARSHTVNHKRMHTHTNQHNLSKSFETFFFLFSTKHHKIFHGCGHEKQPGLGLRQQMDHGELVGVGVGVKHYPDLFLSDVVV